MSHVCLRVKFESVLLFSLRCQPGTTLIVHLGVGCCAYVKLRVDFSGSQVWSCKPQVLTCTVAVTCSV